MNFKQDTYRIGASRSVGAGGRHARAHAQQAQPPQADS